MSEDMRTLIVASVLCRLFGDHESVPCTCAEEGRIICHFACDFGEEAEAVLKALDENANAPV
jgi:hypothetical protein